MVEDAQTEAKALEGFDEWEEYDPEVDEAPADYGFDGSCTGDAEEGD